jgi:peptidoglycan-N-acetylglucosamine deacetylase
MIKRVIQVIFPLVFIYKCSRTIVKNRRRYMKIIIFSKRSKRQNIFLITSVCVFVGLFLAMTVFRASAVFKENEKALPIYCVDTKEKKIALTFDTNWGDDNMIKILDILDENDVKATFFILGTWMDKYPDMVKEIYKRGHEIGNHSNNHPDFINISKDRIIEEIAVTDAKLMKLIGTGTSIFRFPSGSYNEEAVKIVESTNHFCIQWDVDSIDWKEHGADIEYNRVMKKTRPGSILLFHNGAKYTPETLPKIIKDLKSKGYEFVKVSDLIYKENYYIDYSGKQISK